MCKLLPDYLFKYKSITEFDRDPDSSLGYTRRFLKDGELYFSRFSELADPNEVLFSYAEDSHIAVSEEALSRVEFLENIGQLPDGRHHLKVSGAVAGLHVREALDKRWGVYCLTEDEKNLLMFDYYGGGHRGICIKIDWRKIGILVKETSNVQQPTKVRYIKKPPRVSSDDSSSFDSIFNCKWRDYKHEKEWRFFYTHGPLQNKKGEIMSRKDMVIAIIFGCATSDNDKELVKEWVRDRKDIQFYQSVLSKGRYRLEISEI